MAEAVAGLALAANIIQVIEFSEKVLVRLKSFQSDLSELPDGFRPIAKTLPLIIEKLNGIRKAIEANDIEEETKNHLMPVVDSFSEDVSKLYEVLDKVIPKEGDNRAKRVQKAFMSLSKDNRINKFSKDLKDYMKAITFCFANLPPSLKERREEKLKEILALLSSPDAHPNYQKALDSRHKQTGQWLLDMEEYQKWKVKDTFFLWLYGIPGCGKTVLSSTVIEDTLKYCSPEPRKIVVYFYFSFNDDQKKVPLLMLQSILRQLLLQSNKIPKYVDWLFSLPEYKIARQQLSKDEVLKLLKHTIKGFLSVYLVIDALDESTQIEELMEILETIASWELQNLRMLVTSRKERYIEDSLKGFINEENAICLQQVLVDEDISRYVQYELNNNKNLQKWHRHSDVMEEVKESLTNGAKGMFRWAACQLDELAKCRTLKRLRASIAGLPSTLDETYDRILASINEDDSVPAIRILRWLAFCESPLTLDQVAEIAAINVDEEPGFDPDDVLEDPQDAQDILSSLVTTLTERPWIDKSPRIVLAHYSVKEYLLSERSRQGCTAQYSLYGIDCNDFLASGCLGYLLRFPNSNTINEETTMQDYRDSSFAKMAACDWVSYYRKVDEQSGKSGYLASRLLLEKFSSYAIMFRLQSPYSGDEVEEPILYTAQKGLKNFIEPLLDKNVDVNTRDDNGHDSWGSVLSEASSGGHKETVKLLLDRGADPNLQNGTLNTALLIASYEGYIEIVELLLKRGADPNLQSERYDTALQAASHEGYIEIVELLLNRGANINLQGGEYHTALQAASHKGYIEIVELLLNRGANINPQGGEYHTALQAASHKGYIEIVELLLNRGANINPQGGIYHTALQAASYEGYIEIVELLLDRGANPNLYGGRYGSPLAAAIAAPGLDEEVEAIVKKLLSHGADANVPSDRDGRDGTVLHLAICRDRLSLVKLLLEYGADANARSGRDGRDGTVLHRALREGWPHPDIEQDGGNRLIEYETVVKLLLEHGADANARSNRDVTAGTVLHLASSYGYLSLVKLLLEYGADANARSGRNGRFLTVLQLASCYGYLSLVKLLLEHGADANAPSGRDGCYGTVLHTASSTGQLSVVKLLLEHGADVNAKYDIPGGNMFQNVTPLELAYLSEEKSVIHLLREKGAVEPPELGRLPEWKASLEVSSEDLSIWSESSDSLEEALYD